MVRGGTDWLKLWSAPFEMARTGALMAETAVNAQSVIAARVPMIAEAFFSPWTANHRELGLMVSEKVSAMHRSSRAPSAARLRTAMGAQASAFGKWAGGGWLGPADWWAIAERQIAIATAGVMVPGELWGPFHAGAAANAKRLAKPLH